MSESVDRIMESASQALARMDYLTCEDRCVEALAQARRRSWWASYARILLPLQEARRQRRMIAAEGTIRLGTADLQGEGEDWLEGFEAGCLVVTHPHGAAEARRMEEQIRRRRLFAEVLLADSGSSDSPWTLCSFQGPPVHREVEAPPAAWRNRWLRPHERPGPAEAASRDLLAPPATPADWFIDATQALGDAAIEQVRAPLGDLERVCGLEARLEGAADHELLHQRLAEAARAMEPHG